MLSGFKKLQELCSDVPGFHDKNLKLFIKITTTLKQLVYLLVMYNSAPKVHDGIKIAKVVYF